MKKIECQLFKDQGQYSVREREKAQMVPFISSRRLHDISLLSLCLIESEAICYESGLSEISRSGGSGFGDHSVILLCNIPTYLCKK